ncbi:hypothetical protein EV193_11117 [Herbihabitans rhizosphaerae]|uniref:DUF6879 domain-containing protein n=1 Tax=Herbihabitans rhizosphaerae TaxID=1872711 RepID=A0A4Q7KEW9_9PSEU|nr:DUF6879 family protein [Herbihabitans rhizosphaerae]RZS32641.1 hypothetical protein EV193_11117 [Herbihabitans rhizosphaerae]
MELRKVSGGCEDGDCPAVYLSDTGTLVFQGTPVERADGLRLGPGERAGEDYRILDLTEKSIDLPQQDFWLFDDSTVALLNFNDDGTLRNRELADPSELDKYRSLRDLALAKAASFLEYRT